VIYLLKGTLSDDLRIGGGDGLSWTLPSMHGNNIHDNRAEFIKEQEKNFTIHKKIKGIQSERSRRSDLRYFLSFQYMIWVEDSHPCNTYVAHTERICSSVY
jgi:hypothetical protein